MGRRHALSSQHIKCIYRYEIVSRNGMLCLDGRKRLQTAIGDGRTFNECDEETHPFFRTAWLPGGLFWLRRTFPAPPKPTRRAA
jgi:hypothetical protein